MRKARLRRYQKVLITVVSIVVVLALGFTTFLGVFAYVGPLKELNITRLQGRYSNRPKGEIVFYGASNFTYWFELENDMQPLAVRNYGFGGSTDNDLIAEAEKLLYPAAPSVVVFQSGSNDFTLGLSANDVCENKDRMYSYFRENLPDTVFVVLSMLPLPGRTEHWDSSKIVNEYLRSYCERYENMLFIDATTIMMTAYDEFRPELFRNDGIHLNRDGQLLWGSVIKPVIEDIS